MPKKLYLLLCWKNCILKLRANKKYCPMRMQGRGQGGGAGFWRPLKKGAKSKAAQCCAGLALLIRHSIEPLGPAASLRLAAGPPRRPPGPCPAFASGSIFEQKTISGEGLQNYISSRMTISAASPRRGPFLMIRVYPPPVPFSSLRCAYLGASSRNSFSTTGLLTSLRRCL